MTTRNDRLWHAAHEAHRLNLSIKLLRNGDLEAIGYVVQIDNHAFVLDGGWQRNKQRYEFNRDDLRIEP